MAKGYWIARVDVRDAEAVEWAIATRVQPDRDVIVVPGCRGSSLDPSRSESDDTTARPRPSALMSGLIRSPP